MDLLTETQLTAQHQGSVVVITNMNIILKAIFFTLLFFALSMVLSLIMVVAYQEPPPKPNNSLLTNYSKLDITTNYGMFFVQ